MQELNIIGVGKLGRTLGRLATVSGQYRVQACLARSMASAQTAVGFIGDGQACSQLAALRRRAGFAVGAG
jgi:hypothetical protein